MTQSRTFANDLYHDYRTNIASGIWPPGSRLPPIRDLMKTSGKAQGTVVAALAALKADGLIETSRGRRGTFVSENASASTVAGRVDLISLDGAMKINDSVRFQMLSLERGIMEAQRARVFVEALKTTVTGLEQIAGTYENYSQQAQDASDDLHAIDMAAYAVPFNDFVARLRVVRDRAMHYLDSMTAQIDG